MYEDIFVIDATVHAQDFRHSNRIPPQVKWVVDSTVAMIKGLLPPEAILAEPYIQDLYSAENTTNCVFLESYADLASTHHLPLYSFLKSGAVSIEMHQELVARWPARWITYAGVDPTQGVDAAIKSLEHQVELIPQTVGVKVYPTQTVPKLKSFRMDDEEIFPLWQRVQELGLKVVAVHKNMPYGPVPTNPFRVGDVEGAATEFPDLNFELVHGGVAFTEETATAIARYPNVYTNLEGTCWLLPSHRTRRRFEEILAEFIQWGGADKIIWGSGAPLVHPQACLEAFIDLTFSEETMNRYGVDQITRAQKADILGGVYARMIGLDIDKAKRDIADDEFTRAKREHGVQPAFSTWDYSQSGEEFHSGLNAS